MGFVRHESRAGVVFVLTLMLAVSPARAASIADVESMITAGKAYLYSQQRNGNWESVPAPAAADAPKTQGSNWGGVTALCVYALLAAGEDPQGEKLARPIEFLKKAQITGTYALAVRCQVWLLLAQTADVKQLMKRDAAALMALMKSSPPQARGFYDYGPGGAPEAYSLSRAQYGVLGVWAAAQVGVEVPAKYWEIVEKAWVAAQQKDGGWMYQFPPEPRPVPIGVTPGITAAGVATLFIAQEFDPSAGRCNGNLPSVAIDRGMKYMETNFELVATDKKYERSFPYATLYAVERIGVASGRKYFGSINWFDKGVTFLKKMQARDGSWGVDDPSGGSHLPNSCFAMLFLARGRSPILMNKLEFVSQGESPSWNQRPRDVGNLTRWLGHMLERELNWQIITLDAPIGDLFDAPVLFISGTKAAKFDDAQIDKLRQYVEGGGMLLGHADCAGKPFGQSFKEMLKRAFPAYALRELPEDHPVYAQGFPRSKWKAKPSVLGISNGTREIAILIPDADPGKAWQTQASLTRAEMYQLGASIFLYAIDKKNLRYRGDSHWVALDAARSPKNSLNVARLKYDGNWDPEPGGWRRLSAILHNQNDTTLQTSVVNIAAEPIAASVAHLTGTAAVKFSDVQRSTIKKFIDNGGTLIVDAAGGSTAFATSVEAELAAILPSSKLGALPLDHTLYSAGDAKLDKVDYRRLAKEKVVGKSDAPRLQGITVGNRCAVIYSREDLTTGLVGSEVDGILGYDPPSAVRVMTQILTYAAKVPPTAPAKNPFQQGVKLGS